MPHTRGAHTLKLNGQKSAKPIFLMDQRTTSEQKHDVRFQLASVLWMVCFAPIQTDVSNAQRVILEHGWPAVLTMPTKST